MIERDIPIEYLVPAQWADGPVPQVVKTITDKPVPARFGRILVSMRSETEYVIIDGLSRVTSMIALGHAVVPCLVETGLTQREEAKRFIEINSRSMRGPMPDIEKVRAALTTDACQREDHALCSGEGEDGPCACPCHRPPVPAATKWLYGQGT